MSIPTKTPPNDINATTAPTILRASCAPATDASVLPNGKRLRFRPTGSDDRDGLAALFARLTPESRRRRFLSPKRELTRRELAFLTEIDHVGHEAIAAVDEGDGSIVGIGRYVRVADCPEVAEVAVVVADGLQSMGIGTALASCILRRALVNGFTRLNATTLWENRPARALLRRFGFRARSSHGGEIELELELDRPSERPARTRDLLNDAPARLHN
jgi:RimJ/RimL family protein N-acetyltransferase